MYHSVNVMCTWPVLSFALLTGRLEVFSHAYSYISSGFIFQRLYCEMKSKFA